jgi:hypothetical protein
MRHNGHKKPLARIHVAKKHAFAKPMKNIARIYLHPVASIKDKPIQSLSVVTFGLGLLAGLAFLYKKYED